jgi:hypothetical protein
VDETKRDDGESFEAAAVPLPFQWSDRRSPTRQSGLPRSTRCCCWPCSPSWLEPKLSPISPKFGEKKLTLPPCRVWPGLKAVVVVESTREIKRKVEQETRCYITSLVMLRSLLGPVVRSHWAIENSPY